MLFWTMPLSPVVCKYWAAHIWLRVSCQHMCMIFKYVIMMWASVEAILYGFITDAGNHQQTKNVNKRWNSFMRCCYCFIVFFFYRMLSSFCVSARLPVWKWMYGHLLHSVYLQSKQAGDTHTHTLLILNVMLMLVWSRLYAKQKKDIYVYLYLFALPPDT